VLWLHFVLLVDADMHVFAALDARALAALCEGASPTRDVTTFLYLTAVLACTPVFFYLRRRSFAR
jgi:hypothetical protein